MRNTIETTTDDTTTTDSTPVVDGVKTGKRKVVAADGSVSYGVKSNGERRKKPGRKPKVKVS